MRITVGVPFLYDEPGPLLETVRSFLEPEVDVIAVDNGASEECGAALSRLERVTAIRNAANVYVNPAWNQIAERFLQTSSDILAIANSDVVMRPGWARALREYSSLSSEHFWLGRLIEQNELTSYGTDESFQDAQIWAPGGSWGAFFVLRRRDVERVFPIPGDLKLHLGDNWIFEFLIRTGVRARIVNDVKLWHESSRNFDRLPNRHELTERDRIAWSSHYAFACKRAADAAVRGSKMDKLEMRYVAFRDTPFDINEHLPTIRAYASECAHVTEFGFGRSTVALAHARPKKLRCYDPYTDPIRASIDEVLELARSAGVDIVHSRESDLVVTIEETDLLLIDTIHTFAQLSAELERHAGSVRKYILMHDTETFGEKGEDGLSPGLNEAIDRFLAGHIEWELIDRYKNNNGLTILTRVSPMKSNESDGRWNAAYAGASRSNPQAYGVTVTYQLAADFLKGLDIEDWGCGLGWMRQFVPADHYTGIDGSKTPFADKVVKLSDYRSKPDGLFMRHVIEHNHNWLAILNNALESFQKRMVLVLFTPLGDETKVLLDYEITPGVFIPELTLSRKELMQEIAPYFVREETVKTATRYEVEHVFYLEKKQEKTSIRLVTGFFRLSDREVDEAEQFRLFHELARCGLPITVFLDDRPKHPEDFPPNVTVVPFELGELWPFRQQAKAKDLDDLRDLPPNRTQGKDTREFLLLQNSKLEMLHMASVRDSEATHFAWIDFGIMKIVKDREAFRQKLRDLDPPESCVLTPGCWNKEERTDWTNSVDWRFCGGFLLASRDRIEDDLVKKHREVFKSAPILTWEVNVWAEMERRGTKFDWYKADHDDSIVPDHAKSEKKEEPPAPDKSIMLGVPCFQEPRPLLNEAILSFFEPLVRIVAVDNGASKECKETLESFGDAIEVIHNPENLYVNAAWNQLAERFLASDASILVIANADAILSRGWAQKLLDAAKPGQFWRGRGVKTREDLEAPTPEMSAHTSGTFFALDREAVQACFPIPPELKVWYGDNWIWETLERLGRQAVALDTIRVWHAESVSSKALSNFAELVWADKAAWDGRLARECRERPLEKPMVDVGYRTIERINRIIGHKRVCLVMIVKNESAIIERCLTSALPYIDSWCITDTGSTDGTPGIIEKFFAARSIPGRIFRTSFVDFAQARNESLAAAQGIEGWDYALLIDADMVLAGTLDRSALEAPAYQVLQRNANLDYWNTRLVHRNSNAKYVGVTHEFLSVDGVARLESIRILDLGDGGSKGDKCTRDIRLLKAGLEKEPRNERYAFYLAQTLREIGRYDEAIDWYQRRIALGGWDEEVWFAHHGLAMCHKAKSDEAAFVKACLDAYQQRPSRGEPLKMLAQYYREHAKNELACLFAEELAKIPLSKDALFVERAVYDYGADEELAIAGFYGQRPERRAAGYRACVKLTTHPLDFLREQSRKNFCFYAKSAKELFGAENKKIEFDPEDGYHPMNPSCFIDSEGRRMVLIRTVNYTVTKEGQYPTSDGSGIIRTRNWLKGTDSDWNVFTHSGRLYNGTDSKRNNFPVEGYEDCRLWEDNGSWMLSATSRDLAENPSGQCEMVVLKIGKKEFADKIVSVDPIRDYHHAEPQKNWMPILTRPGQFLYLCDPTIVVERYDGKTREVSRHEPRGVSLKDLRGGSQVIPIKNGWLCLTHEVSWRPERAYLHRFVRFNEKFEVSGISDPFYFEHVGIEFCAGLAWDSEKNKLVASFGVEDRSAHLAFFDSERVRGALHELP